MTLSRWKVRDSTLNLEKILQRGSINKKFNTHAHLENLELLAQGVKLVAFLLNRVTCGKPLRRVKTIVFETKRFINYHVIRDFMTEEL